MSYQRRILEIELIGSTRSFEAAENRINAGMNRIGSGARRMGNDLGLVDRQLMAIGTTARYALAGSLIFGITGAIQKLQDFQNQLGTVAGLVGTVGAGGAYHAPSNNFISGLGDQAQLISNQVGIATDDVQSYMQRFYSAFSYQNPQSRRAIADMKAFTGEVARLGASMGAEAGDPQAMAGGIAGFINQMPGGRRNVGRSANRVANMIYYLTAQTPNITGADISRDIGRIGAAGLEQAGMTPEQVFAIWTQAGKAGGSSSVVGRGVAQLMSNLNRPSTPAQIAAYRRAGLPTDPNSLRRMGGMRVLQAMMRSATTGPVSARNIGALNDEGIDDPSAAIGAAGVRGVNLNQVYGLFQRQESARQFVNLLAQGGATALPRFIRSIQQAEGANQAYAREQAALSHRTLARFGVARQNVSLSLARGVDWPLEHLVAPPIIHASNFLAGHRTARTAVDAALGAVLARAAFRRFRIARRGGGMGAAGAAIAAEEAPNLVGGGTAAPTGSRADPLWVMISPASWMVGSPGGFSSPAGGGKQGEAQSIAKKIFGAGATGIAARIGTLGALGGADAALGATGVGLPAAILLAFALGGNGPGSKMPSAMQKLVNRPGGGGYFSNSLGNQYFRGSLDVTTRLVDSQGRTIATQQHKGVPVKNWPQSSLPSYQGKRGSGKN